MENFVIPISEFRKKIEVVWNMRRLIFLSIFAVHFAIKRTFKMMLSSSNRGFSQSSLKSKVVTNPKDSIVLQQESMEKEIQNKINSIQNLREVVNLKEEVKNIEKIKSNLNFIEQLTTISPAQLNNLESKTNRIAEIELLGWNENTIHNKLLEITWDVAATHRNLKHEKIDEKITNEMNYFMDTIANYSLHGNDVDGCFDGKILDVGCGDGILLKFLKKFENTQKNLYLHQNSIVGSKQNKKNIEENYYGIDLSNEMLKYARKNYKKATFFQGDFLNFSSPQSFQTIIFNGCLHNFLNITETLLFASKLLVNNINNNDNNNDGETKNKINLKNNNNNFKSRIVISHPKGLNNIILQNSKNKWLSPSLLPSTELEFNEILKKIDLKMGYFLSNKSHYIAILELI
jgi:SAM-dependent methyltransferase